MVAADGGAPRPPAWWLNLCADPHARIQVGADILDVGAREATGEERAALWQRLAAANRYLDRVAQKAGRTLPDRRPHRSCAVKNGTAALAPGPPPAAARPFGDHGDRALRAVDDVVGDAAEQCADAAVAAAADDDLVGVMDLGGSDDRRRGGSDRDVALVRDRGEALAVTLEAVHHALGEGGGVVA